MRTKFNYSGRDQREGKKIMMCKLWIDGRVIYVPILDESDLNYWIVRIYQLGAFEVKILEVNFEE